MHPKAARAFTRWMGCAPSVFRARAQLQRALPLLAKGQALVDVAQQAGFADQSHFSRIARTHSGLTRRGCARCCRREQVQSVQGLWAMLWRIVTLVSHGAAPCICATSCPCYCCCLPGWAAGQRLWRPSPQQAARDLAVFLDGIPELGPGYAVVIVDRDQQLLGYTRGLRNASSEAPLTMHTPMYIASQTKSYMGLLAQVLDQQGVLRLDSTLADHWPQLRLPDGVDPAAWTLADLLNHRVPLSADAITTLEAYIGSPDPALYPQLLQQFASKRADGFDYDNLGYNIYAAILQQHTRPLVAGLVAANPVHAVAAARNRNEYLQLRSDAAGLQPPVAGGRTGLAAAATQT